MYYRVGHSWKLRKVLDFLISSYSYALDMGSKLRVLSSPGFCHDKSYPIQVFFPDEDNLGQVAYAKVICSKCDVSEECLEVALENKEYGIWGGTTEGERRRIKRQRVLRTYVSPDKTQHEPERPAYERSFFPSHISASSSQTPSALRQDFARRLECYGSGIEVSTLQSPEVLSWGPNQKSLVSRVLDEFESFQTQLSQQPGYDPATLIKTGRQLFQDQEEQSSLNQDETQQQPTQLFFQDLFQEAS